MLLFWLLFLYVFLWFTEDIVYCDVISTIAGSSTSGNYSGDGGYATSARLNLPFGVALDSTG